MSDDESEPRVQELPPRASRFYTFDRDGQPIPMHRFSELLADPEYKRVAFDEMHRGQQAIMVSTVWLGFDHGFGADHEPIIFETMVFGGRMDRQCWRYSTEGHARLGHAQAVRKASITLVPPPDAPSERES